MKKNERRKENYLKQLYQQILWDFSFFFTHWSYLSSIQAVKRFFSDWSKDFEDKKSFKGSEKNNDSADVSQKN